MGCAETGSAAFGFDPSWAHSMVVEVPSPKVVVVGPARIHAYSADSGGVMFAAAAKSGTDADCQANGGQSRTQEVGVSAERMLDFEVRAGEVACLATTTRGLELQWHRHAGATRAPVAVASSER